MAADGNPSNPMAATQSGEKTKPPMLDPLYADASAAGRLRTNHGATIALTAAAPMVTHPPPLNSVATKSCHGSCASAQPATPIASASEPALVTRAKPKQRYSLGRLAMTIAPRCRARQASRARKASQTYCADGCRISRGCFRFGDPCRSAVQWRSAAAQEVTAGDP